MKMLAILLTAACLQLGARGFSQGISISLREAPFEKMIRSIEKQSHYRFVYTQEAVMNAKAVTIEVKNESIENILEQSFRNQPLSYTIDGKYIVIKLEKGKAVDPFIEVKGRVTNERGESLVGSTITNKRTKKIITTDERGEFALAEIQVGDIIEISHVGHLNQELRIAGTGYLQVILKISMSSLDETIVVGYGTTTQRFNLGSVSKVTAEDIKNQPVSNPLAALQGRVPGLVVNSTSGIPGSSFTVQIRGQNSLNPLPGTINPLDNPLFIIDGVPFAPQNTNINQYLSLASPPILSEVFANPYGGISPFYNINPADIESIEVLRDADATAIYGSRGANGVILITTKKGAMGKTNFTLNYNGGISNITRTMPLMNTQQYLEMRREAFRNDGITPTNTLVASDPGYAPDFFYFDTTRYKDWKEDFVGGHAVSHDINLSLGGGEKNTNFLLNSAYHTETNIYPGEYSSNRVSANLNLNHRSTNKKLLVDLTTSYSYAQSKQSGNPNLLMALTLPPNFPDLLDQVGNIQWFYNGVDLVANPESSMRQRYYSWNYNFGANNVISYEITKNLVVKTSFGYSKFIGKENSQRPRTSVHPSSGNTISYSDFGTNDFETLIFEPQLTYQKFIKNHRWNLLVGGTYQHSSNKAISISCSNYPNDDMLGSINGAANRLASGAEGEYKYIALFGRLSYSLHNRYLINLNARRDGSSRFGPNNQFGNFGSIAAGWIFSEERFIKGKSTALTFGKLRASFGTTGNDKIGDYQYVPRWASTLVPYQGTTIFIPQNLYNPEFSWSVTKKMELGIELGFLKDKLLISAAWYQNRCGNQLISYRLPSQAWGYDGVVANFPGLVQNKGWEFFIRSNNIQEKSFRWNSTFNLTIHRNKLIAFPGIESSSYYLEYTIGQSLNRLRKYKYTGINDSTGLYTFEDLDKNGVINPFDFQVVGDRDPKFSGGFGNSISYKTFQFEIFLEFRKQVGPNYLQQLYSTMSPPGSIAAVGSLRANFPTDMLSRWQKIGDGSDRSRFSTIESGVVANSNRLFSNSSGAYGDASFIRCKTISLSYSLTPALLKRMGIDGCRFYLNAQNVFTITKYLGNDPETMSYFSLPPLKTFVLGISVTL